MDTYGVLGSVARNWWMLLVRGVFAVLFGVLAFALPGMTLLVLVLLFGVYALSDGLTAFWVAYQTRLWGFGLLGLLGVAIGVCTFIYPGITALALVYLIAIWAIARGILEVTVAIQLRRELTGEWALVVSGLISVALGVVLSANPAAGALAMVWVIGTGAFVFGVLTIILAFRLRSLVGKLGTTG